MPTGVPQTVQAYTTTRDQLNGARRVFMDVLLEVAPHVFDDLTSNRWHRCQDWARHWNIAAPWVIEIATATLELRRLPPLAASREWAGPGGGGPVPEDPAFSGWNCLFETEAAFRARVEDHIAEIKRIAEQADLVQPLPKRERQHFVWLVQYQVLGLSYAEIAKGIKALKCDVSTPRKAVVATADLIDLPLRKASHPKRKQKASSKSHQ